MKKIYRLRLLALSVASTALLSSACGKDAKETVDKNIDLTSYPIKTDVTLSYFMPLRPSLAGLVENYSETDFAKEAEKRTGVKVEYIHPSVGQESSMLSLLIASNELPDIMWGNWPGYSGGINSAFEENVIVPLSKYKKYAPAYFNLLETHPDWARMAKTDDGEYFGFHAIQGSPKLCMVSGPTIRQDWLDELGLKVPETIEEWETVLTAFKEKKGATAPFSVSGSGLTHLYCMLGSDNALYVDGNKFKHAYIEPERKEALTVLNRWFEKGLLDKNFATIDSKTFDAQILTGQTGAGMISGGDIGRYLQAATDPNFNLVGIPYIGKEKGMVNDSMSVNPALAAFASSAISGQCKYPELAAKYLDYFYTDEGCLFSNFGVEGVTYNMVDGKPVYTDLVLNNPKGLSVMEALGLYVKAGDSGAFECKEDYILQYYKTPQQKQSLNAWQRGFKESTAHRQLPVSLTAEEAQEVSDITTEIYSYTSPTQMQFITGQKPISEFDEYVKEINDLGMPRVLEIYNAALERYNNR